MPRSRKSVEDFILQGSIEGNESKYIACCKTLEGLKKFYKLRNDENKRIAKITLPDESKCIDLTNDVTQSMHLRSRMSKDFANKFETVLVKGKIRHDCIEYIKNPWIGTAASLNI